jgi:chromosome segregation ATPase
MSGDGLRRPGCFGALTSQLISKRKRLEGRVECLQTQHTEAIRDKSVAENKSRNLLNKVTVLEKEKEDLGRRLNDEKKDAEYAHAKAQAARKYVADLELELKNMHDHHKKTESTTRAGVDRVHTLFVDAYHDLGAQTA